MQDKMFISSIHTKKNLQDQRMLGAYYTPREVCQILSDWAITDKRHMVLEPSFGGCCFLEAASSRLAALGAEQPNNNLFGSDIDPHAFLHLNEKIGVYDIKKRFLQSNFLSLEPSSFKQSKFDSVIGNPPYISNHNTSAEQKKIARQVMDKAGYKVAKLCSLWGYFVLHSLSFLNDCGRLALILPRSFLQADYAKYIRETLVTKFSKVRAIVLHKRLFLSEGTKENTVIVLGEGYNEKPLQDTLEIMDVATLNELSEVFSKLRTNNYKPKLLKGTAAFSLLDKEIQVIYRRLIALNECKKFSELVDIKIGTVTGANRFFVIEPKTAREKNLTDFTKPILAKFAESPGLNYSEQDFNAALVQNKRCLILNTSDISEKGSALRNYLATFPRKDRLTNATFNKRGLWYSADDRRIPDGFLTYMHHTGPRLVLNRFKVNCTNTIHRVYFKKKMNSVQKKLLAISLLTTFTQFSAEVHGRCYGSGVLKLEPSEAKCLFVLLPDICEYDIKRGYRLIDRLLRLGRVDEARDAADSLIVNKISRRIERDAQKKLCIGLSTMRENRRYNSTLN